MAPEAREGPVRAHVVVSGYVQGVFFRATTRETARSLGLGGWVRNLPDGRVEAVFEGPRSAVLRAVSWCRTGPPSARVLDVEVTWQEPQGESGFRVTY
jgi:acylphosphatase